MLGYIIAGFLISIISILIIIGVISAATEKEEVKVKDHSVLHLTLNDIIQDRGEENPFEKLDMGGIDIPSTIGLNTILENIEKAKNDDRIKGIYLELTGVNAGIAIVEEIRNALLNFKESDKFIIANSYNYSQTAYYLATTADEIFINPEGMMFFVGMSAEVTYFKGTLDKLGIEAQVVRHGKFKSAIEPFTRKEMSDENREQYLAIVSSIWNNVVKNISKSRNIPVDKLNNIADSLKATLAQELLDANMVDGIKYEDEVESRINEILGQDEEEEINLISLKKYKETTNENKKYSKNKIAVIYAEGNIVTGKGDDKIIGSDSYVKHIEKAREDSSIKAVVLRINSPGGSATASDMILREIKLTQMVKPVVVSMGDLAASGGYYIACSADKIIANPTTLTGSIGVFGMFFNADKLLSEKLGINVQTVKTNTHADFGNISREFTETEYNAIHKMIEEVYKTFVNHVMDGRDMTWEEVDNIAQGRVWSGTDAMRIGLVDELGGINKAISNAVELSGVEDYRLVEYPEIKDPIQELLSDLSGETKLQTEMGEAYHYYKHLRNLINTKGIQAKLPYSIQIK